MHPRSPRQDRPTPWSENLIFCISSRYSRFAVLALAFTYLLMSFSLSTNHQRILTQDNTEVTTPILQTMQNDSFNGGTSTKQKKERVDMKSVKRRVINHTKDSYLPSHAPVLTPERMVNPKQVNVRFLMGSKPFSQSQHLLEGIERSAVLKLISLSLHSRGQCSTLIMNDNSNNDDNPTVYIVDIASLELDCHIIQRLIQHVLQESDNYALPTAVVLMDDSGSTERLHCPHLETIIPKERIRMTRRNIVQNRYWDAAKEWIHMGELSPNDGNVISGGPILFSPFAVRDSFVFDMSIALKRSNQTNMKSIVDLKRKRDVAHFWQTGDYWHYSSLRNKVGAIVESLSGEYSNGRKLHTVTTVVGKTEKVDQGIIDLEYIEQMISTKIIVVAQRDEWEGHLRLMEALASGGMVIADKTLAMPSGLVDRESIILYDSAEDLKDALFYYLSPKNDNERLAIAKRGWEVAMGRHRSWHRVEEVIFGKPQTQFDQPWEPTPKKQKTRIPYLRGNMRISSCRSHF